MINKENVNACMLLIGQNRKKIKIIYRWPKSLGRGMTVPGAVEDVKRRLWRILRSHDEPSAGKDFEINR